MKFVFHPALITLAGLSLRQRIAAPETIGLLGGGAGKSPPFGRINSELAKAGIRPSMGGQFGMYKVEVIGRDAGKARSIIESLARKYHFLYEPLPEAPLGRHYLDGEAMHQIAGSWVLVSPPRPVASGLRFFASRVCIYRDGLGHKFRAHWDRTGHQVTVLFNDQVPLWPRWKLYTEAKHGLLVDAGGFEWEKEGQ